MPAFLAAPQFQPFAVAGLVVLGLLVIEVVSTVFGASASTLLDSVMGLHGAHLDLNHGSDTQESDGTSTSSVVHGSDGLFASAFDWLNAGRVPMLVLLTAAIACFAVTGMVMQIVATNLLAPLPVPVATLVAAAASVPATRWTSRLVSRIIPRDETYAITGEDLIGRVGIVTLGPVTEGAAARAKVQDQYGNWHFPRITPGTPGLSIPEGASVLIVDQTGGTFAVIEAEGRLGPTPKQ